MKGERTEMWAMWDYRGRRFVPLLLWFLWGQISQKVHTRIVLVSVKYREDWDPTAYLQSYHYSLQICLGVDVDMNLLG